MRDKQPDHIGYCDQHAKRLFSSRKQAKKHIRAHREKTSAMREYRCDLVDGHWHIGHLPLAVVEGRKTTRQVYGSQR